VQTLPSLSTSISSRRSALTGLATLAAIAVVRSSAAQAASAALQVPASLARAQESPTAPSMAEKPTSTAHQNLTSIHYEIDFKAAPQRFYNAILDQKQFAAFSGLPATIDPMPGGAFSMFGGLIAGRNVELVSNQRIVQAWRPGHWDPGIYSIVRFELKPRGEELTLIFDHTAFPAGEYDHLDFGWHSHYWEPLKKYFAS
jgi:activator of HSP90 ATPase